MMIVAAMVNGTNLKPCLVLLSFMDRFVFSNAVFKELVVGELKGI